MSEVRLSRVSMTFYSRRGAWEDCGMVNERQLQRADISTMKQAHDLLIKNPRSLLNSLVRLAVPKRPRKSARSLHGAVC